MNDIDKKIDNIKQYFEEKDWIYVIKENGTIFYKKTVFLPTNDVITNPSKKVIDYPFNIAFNHFYDITMEFVQKKIGKCEILNPLNIYNAYEHNSFVSTGLEYYYNYLYKNESLSCDKSIILQPSIRFKLDFFNNNQLDCNDKYYFSSISFNNLSIVHFEKELDMIKHIENILDYFSMLKIYASRVNFVVESRIRQKENNISYNSIKFFVDNLEVGDILFFKVKNEYLVEYGFGLERLLSRILNKRYRDLFINDNRFDNKTILFSNFFTVLCMFNNEYCNHGAKSKINKVLRNIDKNNNVIDLELVYKNYLFWNQILLNTTYNIDFENLTKKYIKLLRR